MKFALVPTTFLMAAQALAAHTMISNKQEGMSTLWYIPNSKSSPLKLYCDHSLTFIVICEEVAIPGPTVDFGVHLFFRDLGTFVVCPLMLLLIADIDRF